jgi:hypothetical protein
VRKAVFRIIFDRSAFHEERFERIAKSALSALQRQGRVEVYHTPIFLDETLSSYGAGDRAKQWQDHLLYCLDVCNGIFLDREEIWHNELVAGRRQFARCLLPERPNKRYDSRPRLIQILRAKATSGDLAEEWAESAAMRAETSTKKNNQRATSAEIRQTVAKAVKERRVVGSTRDFPFSTFRSREFVRTGRELMDLVDRRRARTLSDQWVQNPEHFPFYSAFVEGFLYAGYYAAAEHNHPLDRNAQPDYELLAYLTWADLVVSDDAGFFQRAFETIWKPRGKRLETADSFAALMDRLM